MLQKNCHKLAPRWGSQSWPSISIFPDDIPETPPHPSPYSRSELWLLTIQEELLTSRVTNYSRLKEGKCPNCDGILH